MADRDYDGLGESVTEADLDFAGRRLDHIFEARARSCPDRTAVVSDGETATYADVDYRADMLARRLADLGVAPNVLVALYVERGIDLIVGILGILKAGGGYLPIDASTPAPRVNWLLRDSGVGIAVTMSSLAERVTERSVVLVLADSEAADSEAAEREPGRGGRGPAPAAERAPTDLAYVIYTSGSTGTPKGVLVEHRHVVRLFEVTQQWFRFCEHDVWTMFHSVAFDFSVWEIWGALLFGGRLVVVPDETCRSPLRFRELLRREQVTVLNQTPSAFRQLDAADRSATDPAPAHLRLVVFGGERLDVGMLAGWMDRWGDERPALVNMYGITETTVHASFRPIHRVDLTRPDRSPIGVPLPDLRFLVLNAAGEPAAAGEPGELYVSGAGVSRGYLHRADITAERFFAHPLAGGERVYWTGDLVLADQTGEYHYVGRVDDQLKVRGFRIEPREIEVVLDTHPEVAASVVVPHDYGDGDVRLIAYLVANDPDVDPGWVEGIRKKLADELAGLPSPLRPSAFVSIPALPLTVNGKVDRTALPTPLTRCAQAEQPALTPVQSRAAAVWSDILNLSTVGPDEDFFDLGGTSLTLIRMLDRVNASFGADIGIETLIEEATIRSLASTLELDAPTS
ncbi:MAG TPA: amino acid adenylation domain-containing protein [Pseudonocardiaceae bacterium]|nr:amino acid adenylation domain-containing protein [Pseudonocardiaceae bacterium]